MSSRDPRQHRKTGWSELLYDAIAVAGQREFSWGTHDCCLFAADVLLATTGTDFAAPVRGYTTREEAEAIIARYGGMEAMITSLVGSDPVHVSRARRGDLVLANLENGPTAGICIGRLSTFTLARGLTTRPTSTAMLAWRI